MNSSRDETQPGSHVNAALDTVYQRYLKWVLRPKFEKHKSGEMAGDIERRRYFLKLNMHQSRCLIAELYIKEFKSK